MSSIDPQELPSFRERSGTASRIAAWWNRRPVSSKSGVGTLLAVLAILSVGCGPTPVYVRPTVPGGATGEVDPARIHAVLINGGGRRAINYQSHLVHLREVLGVLESAGVPADQVAVFASDGMDPGRDLATRELRPENGDAWLLDGTNLERLIGRPMEYVSSSIDGVSLKPATTDALVEWFEHQGADLREGDVVFLYVTDHGTVGRGARGARATAISLWNGDSLDVDGLGALIEDLPRGVQVVTLMSQCFSGGFAQLVHGTGQERPTGLVCGYFSTTHDREAYGCYAENLGDENVGHSVRFLEGLRESGRMRAAQDFTQVHDRTPDVPLRTSDEYGRELLEGAARRQDLDAIEFADGLLARAWQNPARFEKQIRLLDQIGQAFGFASARSLAEVEVRLDQLPSMAAPLAKHTEAWHDALTDLSRVNLDRFLHDNPQWEGRVRPEDLRKLAPEQARALGGELVVELGPATRRDGRTYNRLQDLRSRTERASGVSYRMGVREAALLRMQTVLIEVAASVYLETEATPVERESYEALQFCENLFLPVAMRTPVRLREPFPAYGDDVDLAKKVLPAWMGIEFRQAAAVVREQYDLADGAVVVRRVYPGSPAESAGLEPGDVVLGPPGAKFLEPRQIREWTMLSSIGEPRELEVLRDGERIRRTLVPGAHPGRFPELPEPPGVGDRAPPLRLSAYRSELPAQGPYLLFFWATWCAPCKAALPELEAYAAATGVRVVAITDESPEQLDAFFAQFHEPFPEFVALDPNRTGFLGYGVSGTPTFVLVDRAGVVQSVSTGYPGPAGLGIDGWDWKG